MAPLNWLKVAEVIGQFRRPIATVSASATERKNNELGASEDLRRWDDTTVWIILGESGSDAGFERGRPI